MTSSSTTAAIAELTKPGGTLDLGHDRARLIIEMLHQLAKGHPFTRDQALDAAAELGIARTLAESILDAWTERDDRGDIVGLGLTYNPTPHRMTINGVRVWAWCGMDTLIFIHVLNTPAVIESKAPGSDEVVRLHANPAGITDVTPATAVVTQRVPGADQVDLSTATAIWGTFCHHNHFFPSRRQAEQWAAGRDDIAILALDEGFAVARDMAGALLRYEPSTSRKDAP